MKLNQHWAVRSPRVQIQIYATTDQSFRQGIAVSGDVIGGHTLIAFRDPSGWGKIKVLWDGKEVLANGDLGAHPMPGVQLMQNTGKDYLPTDEELDKLFSLTAGA